MLKELSPQKHELEMVSLELLVPETGWIASVNVLALKSGVWVWMQGIIPPVSARGLKTGVFMAS